MRSELLLFCPFWSHVPWRCFRNSLWPACPCPALFRLQDSGLLSLLCPPLTQCCFSHQSSDILSTIGYDTIIQHLNNGRKNCKEFEDFLKERYMLFLSEDSAWIKRSHTDNDSFPGFLCLFRAVPLVWFYLFLVVHKTRCCTLWKIHNN